MKTDNNANLPLTFEEGNGRNQRDLVSHREQCQLEEIRNRGYVVTRNTKEDQALANRYFYFCSRENYTWVQIKIACKTDSIRVDQFSPVKLDERGKREVAALLGRRDGVEFNFIPDVVDVPKDKVEQIAVGLLRISEANRKRAELPQ
jgi:hypothetical protein